MKFFVGLHQPSDAQHFARCLISIARLRDRKSNFQVGEWILDSGAFTEVATYGDYREPVEVYAAQINRWSWCGNLVAAVAQDYVCAPPVLAKTGLTVADHQRLTIERYDALRTLVRPETYVLPTIQGWQPDEYAAHVRAYGDRLAQGAWVGVGSIAARSEDVTTVQSILRAIKQERPDLRLHAFGLKITALSEPEIVALLESADSITWSLAARKEGRSKDANSWREAARFVKRIDTLIERVAA